MGPEMVRSWKRFWGTGKLFWLFQEFCHMKQGLRLQLCLSGPLVGIP